MAILLALLSALSYGSSDFCAGLASRRSAAEPAAGVVIAVEVVCAGIGLALFAGDGAGRARARTAVVCGVLAGLGFALLFVALDRAGTRSGAWPLVPGQLVALLVVAPGAVRSMRRASVPPARDLALAAGAGVLGGAAVLLFLAATGHGQLSIVAVIASLYPAFTVLLARFALSERWTRPQAVGLLVAAASVALVSVS